MDSTRRLKCRQAVDADSGLIAVRTWHTLHGRKSVGMNPCTLNGKRGSCKELLVKFQKDLEPTFAALAPKPQRWSEEARKPRFPFLTPPVRRVRRRTDKLWPSELIAAFPGSSSRALPRGRAAYC